MIFITCKIVPEDIDDYVSFKGYLKYLEKYIRILYKK